MPDNRPCRSPYPQYNRTAGGMNMPRGFYPAAEARPEAPRVHEPNINAPPSADIPRSKPRQSGLGDMLASAGLDEERLILIAIIAVLAKNGASWTILAALIYIML